MKEPRDSKFIPMTSVDSGKLREIAADVAYYTNQIVNIVMIGIPGSTWVLVDAGMPRSAREILDITSERFGNNNPPSAIVLTHGHFDHIGSIVDLLTQWKCPVYAHPLEFPYLTGMQAYPEPDTSVEGGLLAKISSFYPIEPVDIKEFLNPVSPDGSITVLPEWKWIHVPGHSPGQIALYRKSDRLLISADAFITVRQDSMYRVLTQKMEVCGPPVYLTTDWDAAYNSVKTLADLDPVTVIPGHGTAMLGLELYDGLFNLIKNWRDVALPAHGKWVKRENE